MARFRFRPKDEPYWLGEVLAHETRIVWLLDSARFDDVRQAAIVTRTATGPPSDDLGGTRLLVGYGEARKSGRGLYRRRIFYLGRSTATSIRAAHIVMARRPRQWIP